MILFPNCKINIGLDILRRREDGFHDLHTAMVAVDGLCDILEIVPSGDASGAVFSCSGLAIDCEPENNLCLRAFELMAERFEGVRGVKIHLHKVIPLGAGLGGGSSDAAFVVKGLDRLFGLGLEQEQMEGICAELGSDIAFFIRNKQQMASGRGEVLEPIELPLRGWQVVIVKPDVFVSTAQAYSGITPQEPHTPLLQRVGDTPVALWKGSVANAFEPHIFAAHPQLREIKEQLYGMGASYASMSGSGSAIYGLFEGGKEVSKEDIRGNFSEMFIHHQIL